MKNKILILLLLIAIAFSVIGCRDKNPPPPPLPKDYVSIPDYVTSPDKIEYWHRQVKSRWVSDKDTTGYEDYRFTPVEFVLPEIPDVRNSSRIIIKDIFVGDCDDYALWNPYIAYARLGLKGYVVYILNQGNVQVAHAISYAWNDDNQLTCHVWDNQYYRGAWTNIEAYIKDRYPNWIIYFHKPLDEYLRELFKEGHLEYAPNQPTQRTSRKSTPKKICPIDGVCN
jgi:hypothetical protein